METHLTSTVAPAGVPAVLLTAADSGIAGGTAAWFAGLGIAGAVLSFLLYRTLHGLIGKERRRRVRLEKRAKLAESAAADLEARMKSLFESAPHGICQVLPDNGGIRANPALLAMFGVESGEVLASWGGLASFAVSVDGFAAAMEQLERDSVMRAETMEWKRKDGAVFPASVLAQAVQDAKGAPVYQEWHLVDLTERRAAEAEARRAAAETEEVRRRMEQQGRQMLAQSFELAEARDRALESAHAKSELLASLGQDIRTPLNGIVGMSQLLLARLSGQHREFIEMLNRSAQMLLSSLDEILEYSRLETGQFEAARDNFSLRNLVEQVAESLAGKSEAKGLEMPCLVRVDVPDNLIGDATRIRQILHGIVDNAVRHTSSGEVSITVSMVRQAEERAWVRFQVEDSGSGISPDSFSRLFEPSAQVDWSAHRVNGESSGGRLRLAIAKLLVEKMGGQMGVDSEPGQGSLFWFLLPLEIAPRAEGENPSPPVELLRGRRMLVADDVISCRGVLAELASGWGMLCATASDGPQCLQLLETAARGGEPFDFVMMDLDMPGMGGLELADTILEKSKEWPLLGSPTLILTVPHSHRGWRDEPVLAGLKIVLSKPIRGTELQNALVQAVERSREPQPGLAFDLDELQRYLASHGGPAVEPAKPVQPRVLVVEDNPVNQRVAARLLEKMGYQADVVDNGQKALDSVLARDYSLVLMDCQMPDMDGFMATAAIREQPGDVRNIPIVAMTANAMQGDRERCLAAGMNDYVSKPVDAEVLRTVLARWLSQASAETGVAAQK